MTDCYYVQSKKIGTCPQDAIREAKKGGYQIAVRTASGQWLTFDPDGNGEYEPLFCDCEACKAALGAHMKEEFKDWPKNPPQRSEYH